MSPGVHSFHIPVMGLGFTVDTPARVAHFGISSTVSIMEDHLLERMRAILSKKNGLAYEPIGSAEPDSRARRITAYLDLLQHLVKKNTSWLKELPFESGSPLCSYFEMLPQGSNTRNLFETYKRSPSPGTEKRLRSLVTAGALEVNIMTKVDRRKLLADGTEPDPENSDALSALRGFALSKGTSSIVFSAGLNPRLYSYCDRFAGFFPDAEGVIEKKIVLKVSDYRSALIQGKFLAKKGLWVSEFRIESGLNCGGHAFATDGMLMGPILEEFSRQRPALTEELAGICAKALENKGISYNAFPRQKLTAQGGVGTPSENELLIKHYGLDSVGWGSPFLLVPEATNVDERTLHDLSTAEPSDYYLSYASPLGVPFNNFRKSSSEEQRKLRISKNRPGSPCYKKFLSSNREFTTEDICTASREYQNLKLKQAREQGADERTISEIMEKDCLCEGLGASAILVNGETPEHKLRAVAICPGPNLAYFSGTFTLRQMVDHIYGRVNLLNALPRAHMFINELELYIRYLRTELQRCGERLNKKQDSYFSGFKANLLEGISYYHTLSPMIPGGQSAGIAFRAGLDKLRQVLDSIVFNRSSDLLTI